jgi:hypothetical protein
MPQHLHDDDHDDLAALDFYGADESGSDDGVADSDALDFYGADDRSGEESAFDALGEYAPDEPEETTNELEALDSVTEDTEEEDEEDALQLFTVTNPPGTVSVSALIDGRTQRIDLSAKATSMSESELADEIIVLADLARQKGLAGQHTYLLENASFPELRDVGLDTGEILRDFMENGMKLSTPEQAEAAQAAVFATRYTADHD